MNNTELISLVADLMEQVAAKDKKIAELEGFQAHLVSTRTESKEEQDLAAEYLLSQIQSVGRSRCMKKEPAITEWKPDPNVGMWLKKKNNGILAKEYEAEPSERSAEKDTALFDGFTQGFISHQELMNTYAESHATAAKSSADSCISGADSCISAATIAFSPTFSGELNSAAGTFTGDINARINASYTTATSSVNHIQMYGATAATDSFKIVSSWDNDCWDKSGHSNVAFYK